MIIIYFYDDITSYYVFFFLLHRLLYQVSTSSMSAQFQLCVNDAHLVWTGTGQMLQNCCCILNSTSTDLISKICFRCGSGKTKSGWCWCNSITCSFTDFTCVCFERLCDHLLKAPFPPPPPPTFSPSSSSTCCLEQFSCLPAAVLIKSEVIPNSANRAHSANQCVTLSDTARLRTPSYISQPDVSPLPEESCLHAPYNINYDIQLMNPWWGSASLSTCRYMGRNVEVIRVHAEASRLITCSALLGCDKAALVFLSADKPYSSLRFHVNEGGN